MVDVASRYNGRIFNVLVIRVNAPELIIARFLSESYVPVPKVLGCGLFFAHRREFLYRHVVIAVVELHAPPGIQTLVFLGRDSTPYLDDPRGIALELLFDPVLQPAAGTKQDYEYKIPDATEIPVSTVRSRFLDMASKISCQRSMLNIG